MAILNKREPLKDYISPSKDIKYIAVGQLSPVIVKARQLLADALDKRFFKRYTDAGERLNTKYVVDAQLFLHPRFKKLDQNLKRMVVFNNMKRGLEPSPCTRIAQLTTCKVTTKVRDLMAMVAQVAPPVAPEPAAAAEAAPTLHDDADMYISGPAEFAAPIDVSEGRGEEKLQRWQAEPRVITSNALKYWQQ